MTGAMRAMLTLLIFVLLGATARAYELSGMVLENGVSQSNVLVCVRGSAPIKEPPAEGLVWNIQNETLIPKVMVVRAGQKLTIKNNDSSRAIVVHTVMSKSKEQSRLAIPDGRLEYNFTNPELFARVHLQQAGTVFTGYLCVLEPEVLIYALTDAKGSFVIPNLTPGKYTVETIDRRQRKSSQMVELGTRSVSLIFDSKPPGL
jgi:hypothetical protein